VVTVTTGGEFVVVTVVSTSTKTPSSSSTRSVTTYMPSSPYVESAAVNGNVPRQRYHGQHRLQLR